MKIVYCGCVVLVMAACLLLPDVSISADADKGPSPKESPTFDVKPPAQKESGLDSIGSVVIHPYQAANVGTEVAGIIALFNFDEGDKVEKGKVVAELGKKRYEVTVQESAERLKTLELMLKRAEEELALKKTVYAKEATTQQEVLRAEAEVEVAKAKMAEARNRLKLDELNLEACVINAPFAGQLAVRYKQPFEPVDRLEKIFALVETARVHAVANVPEHLLSKFRRGAGAVFEHATGAKFKGKVDKVGSLVDPKSGTAKVYVLIDNSGGELTVGATGRLEIPR
jgi:RND family efflux transporter MFP subunit